MNDLRNKILVGDNRTTLKDVPSGSVHCCVTSPPFWGLRDYGYDGQIGLEPTPLEYVAEMVKVFREIHRVLRDDGVCWVEIGDSYAGSCGAQSREILGVKPKDMVGIPWMVAFALRDELGFWLRDDVIWNRPNPMPSSVTDRCTKSHSYVFMFTKSARYFFDQEAIKEKSVSAGETRGGGKKASSLNGQYAHRADTQRLDQFGETSATRNKRSGWEIDDPYALHQWLAEKNPELLNEFFDTGKSSFWNISTSGFKGAHFAVFPPKLIEPMILAGSPEKCCSKCGAPYLRQVEKVRVPTRPGTNSKVNRASQHDESSYNSHGGSVVGNRDPQRHCTTTKTVGFEPSCDCQAGEQRAIVIDPFGGSGTTAQVAQETGRDWIMCEGNEDYVGMIEKRTEQGVMF